MRQLLAVIVGAVILAGVVPVVAEGDSTPARGVVTPPPTTVKKIVKRPPKHVVRVVKFTPWARPTPTQVHRIIAIESHGNAGVAATLRRRINCESTFRWSEVYAGHYGLGQFLPSTWARGVASMPRRVRFVVRTRTRRPTRVVRKLSDGRMRTHDGKRVTVSVTRVYRGTLPRHPGITHGWANVRIMRQAIEGRGGVSDGEWSCR